MQHRHPNTNRFGLADKPRNAEPTPEQAAAAARGDAYIAVFALGIFLGWMLKTTGGV